MKANELTGAALDWAVAKCESITERDMGLWKLPILEACTSGQYSPSSNWLWGGPIIEREGMEFSSECCDDSGRYIRRGPEDSYLAKCQVEDAMAPTCAWGPTHLIAAMRCYVASKMGDIVDVPKELL